MNALAHSSVRRPHAREWPGASLPRLLAGAHTSGTPTFDEHLAVHGPLAPAHSRKGQRTRAQAALIDEVERAGLLGRGGAAFPAATKLRAVASARRGGAIVVVNAAEGEPASWKDRALLTYAPHLVLDGALVAATAVGAEEAIVCACAPRGDGDHRAGVDTRPRDAHLRNTANAIEERARLDAGTARVRLASVPEHYVAGQETALVNHLNGGAAKPTFTPPLPFRSGVARRPTLVSNAETLAHLALIARHGAAWFRELGTPAQPGSTLITLSGPAVARPGVYEIEHGAPLSSLLSAAGGTTERHRAALVGGHCGTWIAAKHLPDLTLSNEHLAAYGATMGAGVVVLLSERACPVAETARLARWLSGQSTRQCGPCKHGLDALAASVEQIAAGRPESSAEQRVKHLAALVAGRGACAHPDGAVNVVLSALDTFAEEFRAHAHNGPCEACPRPAELPLPARPLPPTASTRTPAWR
jgi:NADH:ubiquinone oxidoreductase subunit F (NADH-binding)